MEASKESAAAFGAVTAKETATAIQVEAAEGTTMFNKISKWRQQRRQQKSVR